MRSTNQLTVSKMLDYLWALIGVIVTTLVGIQLARLLDHSSIVMLFLIATTLIALRGRYAVSVFASLTSVLAFNFFFVSPLHTFRVSDPNFIITFIVMFLVSILTSYLTIRFKRQSVLAGAAARQASQLLAFTQALSLAGTIDELTRICIIEIGKILHKEAIILLPGELGKLGGSIPGDEGAKLHSIAEWVYLTGTPAGHGTTIFPDVERSFLPLVGSRSTVGVLCLKEIIEKEGSVVDLIKNPISLYAQQVALAIELQTWEASLRQSEIETEKERLRSGLLSSVSHDFRTPLTGIVGSASTLIDRFKKRRESQEDLELLGSIREEGERLSQFVQSLLDATRLESGRTTLKREGIPLEELLGAAINRLGRSIDRKHITIKSEELPFVFVDPIFIEQVFFNILDNAIRYSPSDSTIEVTSNSQKKGWCVICVCDQGKGVAAADLTKLFDKFHRSSDSPGSGLGLAICKAMIAAHGGEIWAEKMPENGLRFLFTLPTRNDDSLNGIVQS